MNFIEITVVCDRAVSESVLVRLHDLEAEGAVRLSVAARTNRANRTASLVEQLNHVPETNTFAPDCKEYCRRKCVCELAMPDAYWRAIADAAHANLPSPTAPVPSGIAAQNFQTEKCRPLSRASLSTAIQKGR
jgi:hypothetical protein